MLFSCWIGSVALVWRFCLDDLVLAQRYPFCMSTSYQRNTPDFEFHQADGQCGNISILV